jgi:general secretion pathway protein D
MQLLEDRNKVTVLATPMLLAANNEVSRLFIGEERPIVRNISSNVAVAGNLGGTVVGGGSSNIEFRPVGTTLLITPQINADRTVTLRILQENSLIISGGASIPVIAADGTVTNQPVDVVSSRTLTGTLVAKDGLSLAMGGLIEEGLNDQREQVPLLGRLPVLGFFFRRQATGRFRRELIIVVRPYILSTPIEGEALSKRLTESLALHPKAGELYPPEGRVLGPLGTYKPHEVLRPNPPANRLQGLLQLHSVLPLDF